MNREIPGFYYDAVKNKYFKMTKDFKKPKPSSEKRLSFKRGHSLFEKLHYCSVFSNQKTSIIKTSQLHLFNQIYTSDWMKAKCIPLEFSTSIFTAKKVSVCPFGQIVVIFSRQDKDECLNIIDASCINKSSIHFSLKDVFSLGNFQGQCLAWSPFQDCHFVYSGTGTLSQNSFVNLCKPLSNTHITLYQDFKNIGYSSLGWSSYDQSVIGVGAHNSTIYLHDIVKRNFISTYKVNSSIQAIQFSKKLPCFFTGCQCGFLYQIDYRSKNKMCILDNSSRLCCIDSLKLLNDENYIIISDLGGKIIKTDIRMKRCVTEFIGHVNNYYPLDFHIDSYENFIFTIGSDSYFRVWDIKTSQLEISACVQGNSTNFNKPCITYSPNLCLNYEYGAMLCCFENKFQVWPLI